MAFILLLGKPGGISHQFEQELAAHILRCHNRLASASQLGEVGATNLGKGDIALFKP